MHRAVALTALPCIFPVFLAAQNNRITQRVDDSSRVSLAGNVSAKARAEYDQGRVTPSLQLSYMTLELAPSAAQKAALQQLLVEQQTPGSANYHQWLTPEQYAQRFGATSSDIAQLSGWLQSHGLTVTSVARGRNWIAFDGQAAQVENAFQTELHQYVVNGESHFANSANPTVPAAFSGVVRAVRGLNDFHPKPRARLRRPDYTEARGGAHYVVPDDLTTIYDLGPLYSAGINGSGQTIAIAGQTEINLSDIETFRSTYGLPANDPQPMLVPNSRNPGISESDLGEADLDTEWSGAVARNATILYVYAEDVMTAVQYAIDDALAPVVSVSYGDCEQETGKSESEVMQGWAEQANAQGITWFAASGDDGAADCADSEYPGLAVDVPGSIPEVTAVGGTEFSEGTSAYWSASNSSTGESALSYIPGVVWNDANGACESYPSASGGGASIFFSKPSWQTGLGVPGDGARDVPDIAINASCAHDPYFVYSAGSLQAYGGTSFGGPIYSGLAALINQYAVSTGAQSTPGQGNFNVRLYALAASDTNAFHDITTGNNIVTTPCTGRGECTNQAVGYTAHAGYSQTTGWGSVDAYLFVTGWTSSTVSTPAPQVTLTLVPSETTIAPTDTVDLIATVTATNGVTPSGSVEFSAGTTVLGSATLTGEAGTGTATATLAVSGSLIVTSGSAINATYSGSSTSVSVTFTSTGHGASGTPSLSGVSNAASGKQSFAPGELISLYGSQLSLSTLQAASLPLPVATSGVAATINGIVAPLMYVSADQVNVQIPYEVTPGTNATLTLNDNGQTASQTIPISTVAPGIFMNSTGAVVPTSSAQAGQQITIYVTGVGAVSPAVADGAAPSSSASSLPMPVQTTTVTVGGATANIQFVGIPDWSAGVAQINFTVPTGLAAGQQQVVVTVGGIASAPALLTVVN